MSFEHCHFCKPPVRHADCHSDCPYYQADIAKYNEAKEEEARQTQERGAEFARADAEGRYIVMRDAEQEGVARLRELAEADKGGRLVVLPCKVGDTVYKVITIQAQKPVLLETQVKTLGQAADVAQLIGKKNKVINIFLTREEAEAALEAMKDE